MKNILTKIIPLSILFWLVACAPAVTPPLPTEDYNATAQVIASTMTSATLTALPTATAIPTSTPQPTATATLLPVSTVELGATPLAAGTATLYPLDASATAAQFTPTSTPVQLQGTLAPAGVNPNFISFMRVENNSDYTPARITLNCVLKTSGKLVYLDYSFDRVITFDIPFGTCQYVVTLAEKKTFTGSITINNYDKTTIRIYNTKIVIVGP